MSIPEQIRALEGLAAVDAELKTLEDQLTQERGTLSTLTAGMKQLDEKLATDRAGLSATEKIRGEFIGEVRSMTQQVEHSRDKLNRSRNERESNAATREIEELRKLLRDREDEVGKLTTDVEASRQHIEMTETELAKLKGELGANEGDINARLTSVEKQRATKLAEREAVMKGLPPALYRKYENIRAKRGFAVAHTTTGTCSACHMALPPQLFHRLRREPLIEQCQSCNRIIYFGAPGEKHPASDT